MAAATAGLKPPPKFATNEWAWSYTLRKMEAKGKLDEHGNPLNYGMAAAIYKAVAKKYGEQLVDLPDRLGEHILANDEARRAQIIDLDAAMWIQSRGMLWAADDETTRVMFLEQASREVRSPDDDGRTIDVYANWRVQETRDGTQSLFTIHPASALWLTRDQPAAQSWVRAKLEQALGFLDEFRNDVGHAARLAQDGQPTGQILDHEDIPLAFFREGPALERADRLAAEIEEALA